MARRGGGGEKERKRGTKLERTGAWRDFVLPRIERTSAYNSGKQRFDLRVKDLRKRYLAARLTPCKLHLANGLRHQAPSGDNGGGARHTIPDHLPRMLSKPYAETTRFSMRE